MPRDEVYAVVKADLDIAIEAMRRQVEAEMFRSTHFYDAVTAPPLPWHRRWRRRAYWYLVGWREALKGLWRALCGQPVWPDEDYQ